MILTLCDEFKTTPEYRRVYNKDSFDNCDTAIDTLEAWKVLLRVVVVEFSKLRDRRNEAIHFRPEVDRNERTLALSAISSLGSILGNQFCPFGPQPWFIVGIPGEIYIKKDWESSPFIRKIYLPNCLVVGLKYKVESDVPWVVKDDYQYDKREVTDEEFCSLRRAAQGS